MIPVVPGDAAPVIVCRKSARETKASVGWSHLLKDLRDGAQRLNCTRGGHFVPPESKAWASYGPSVSDDDLRRLWLWSCGNTGHTWTPRPQLAKRDPPRLSLDKREKEKRVKVPGLKSLKEQQQERRNKWMAEGDTEKFSSLDTMLGFMFGRSRANSRDMSVKGVKQRGRRGGDPQIEIPNDGIQPKKKKPRKKKFRQQWHSTWLRLQGRLSKRFDRELCRIDQDRKETYLLKKQSIFQDEGSSRDVASFLSTHRRKLEHMRQRGPQRNLMDQVRKYMAALETLAESSRSRPLSAAEIFLPSAVCHCLDRGRLVTEQYWFRALNFLQDTDFAIPAVVALIYVFNEALAIDETKYVAYTDLRDIRRLKHVHLDSGPSGEIDEIEGFDGESDLLEAVMASFFNEGEMPSQTTCEPTRLSAPTNTRSMPPQDVARLPRPPRLHPFGVEVVEDAIEDLSEAQCAQLEKRAKLQFMEQIKESE